MNKKFSFIFFGSSPISVTALETLFERGMRPAAVVTQHDKPQGRGLNLTPSPVKAWALKHRGIPIEYWSPDTAELKERLIQYKANVFVLVSFGKILPKEILDMPQKGVVNLHPSLLPKLRGPSPIESTILNDMKDDVGVSIMLLNEEMDQGPILAQRKIDITPWPPKGSDLYNTLSQEGASLLADTLPLWMSDKLTPIEQDHTSATYTDKYEKKDGEIDLGGDPYRNFLRIRAFDPRPGTYFFKEHAGKMVRVKITDATFEGGMLKILKVIPEGRKEMTFDDFLKGY